MGFPAHPTREETCRLRARKRYKPPAHLKTNIRGKRSAAGSFIAAAILAAFYFATSIYIASHRVFWFDELFTMHIARLPDIKAIWTALGHGADSLPPTYYMVVRLFGDLFGNSEVAARLPSALALAAGLLLIFDCARRLTDGLHGLIALSVATCSFLPYYGYEARSYALYFMLSALALWVWFCTRDDKKSSAIFFGVVLCLGVTMHYYFVLCLVPFAIWEVLRGKRGQLASPKLIAGFVGAIVPAALLSPIILSFSHKFSTGFWNRPSFGELRAIFPQLFPDGLFLLVLIVIWIVLADSDKKNVALQPMQSGEAIGWLFLCHSVGGLPSGGVEDQCILQPLFHRRASGRCRCIFVLGVAALPQCLDGVSWNIPAPHRMGSGDTDDRGAPPGVD